MPESVESGRDLRQGLSGHRPGGQLPGGGDYSPKEKIVEAQEQLNFAEALLTKNRIACETHLLVRGNMPGEDLVEFADEQKADLIIIGLKHLSRLGKLVFGSNAAYVVLNARTPVLTLK